MSFLRFFLGTGSVLVAVSFWGFLMLALGYGSAFRSATVRHSTAPMLAMLGVGALAALVLASALSPQSRGLMHITAVVLGLLAGGLALLLGQAPTMSSLGLGGVGLWFLYYWLAVWRTTPPLAASAGFPTPIL